MYRSVRSSEEDHQCVVCMDEKPEARVRVVAHSRSDAVRVKTGEQPYKQVYHQSSGKPKTTRLNEGHKARPPTLEVGVPRVHTHGGVPANRYS